MKLFDILSIVFTLGMIAWIVMLVTMSYQAWTKYTNHKRT